MKTTKLLLTVALVGAASLSAQAGVHFGFSSFGLPLPPLPVFVISRPAPVYVAPAPVYVAPAPVCAPPAVVIAEPACPGPDYIWAPGYWSYNGPRRVWIAASWQHRPSYVVYGHDYDRGHDRDDHRFNNDRDNGHGYDHDRGQVRGWYPHEGYPR